MIVDLRAGEIVAIEYPRIEEVDARTRKTSGSLQAFRIVRADDGDGNWTLVTATGEMPTKYLRLGQGIVYR